MNRNRPITRTAYASNGRRSIQKRQRFSFRTVQPPLSLTVTARVTRARGVGAHRARLELTQQLSLELTRSVMWVDTHWGLFWADRVVSRVTPKQISDLRNCGFAVKINRFFKF